jgi:uncharacterized protein YggU (UPF0235/DUF167 family)
MISVRIQPRARRQSFAGLFGKAIEMELDTPPVNGTANGIPQTFLPKALGVSKSQIEIVSTHANGNERILVKRWDADAVEACLEVHLGL